MSVKNSAPVYDSTPLLRNEKESLARVNNLFYARTAIFVAFCVTAGLVAALTTDGRLGSNFALDFAPVQLGLGWSTNVTENRDTQVLDASKLQQVEEFLGSELLQEDESITSEEEEFSEELTFEDGEETFEKDVSGLGSHSWTRKVYYHSCADCDSWYGKYDWNTKKLTASKLSKERQDDPRICSKYSFEKRTCWDWRQGACLNEVKPNFKLCGAKKNWKRIPCICPGDEGYDENLWDAEPEYNCRTCDLMRNFKTKRVEWLSPIGGGSKTCKYTALLGCVSKNAVCGRKEIINGKKKVGKCHEKTQRNVFETLEDVPAAIQCTCVHPPSPPPLPPLPPPAMDSFSPLYVQASGCAGVSSPTPFTLFLFFLLYFS